MATVWGRRSWAGCGVTVENNGGRPSKLPSKLRVSRVSRVNGREWAAIHKERYHGMLAMSIDNL